MRAPSASLCPYMDFQFPIMGMKGVLFSMLILYITMSYKETMAYRKVKLVTVLDPAGLLPVLSYASIGVGLTTSLTVPVALIGYSPFASTLPQWQDLGGEW